jgi:hypothetical protein
MHVKEIWAIADNDDMRGSVKSQIFKKGQSLVEFVLMLSFVAGLATILKTVLLPRLTSLLEDQKLQAESEAWKGGKNDLREFYDNGCAKKGTC